MLERLFAGSVVVALMFGGSGGIEKNVGRLTL